MTWLVLWILNKWLDEWFHTVTLYTRAAICRTNFWYLCNLLTKCELWWWLLGTVHSTLHTVFKLAVFRILIELHITYRSHNFNYDISIQNQNEMNRIKTQLAIKCLLRKTRLQQLVYKCTFFVRALRLPQVKMENIQIFYRPSAMCQLLYLLSA